MSHKRHRHLAVIISTALFSLITLTAAPVLAAQVSLTWNAPTTNENGSPLTDLAGYKIHYGLSSQKYGIPVDIGNKTSYTLSGLADGVLYYFAVTAYDTSGNESAFSNEVSHVTPLNLPPVASYTATPTSGTAPLSVAFTDASTGQITSWAWTFGDGGTSTGKNPTYTYNTAGIYTVSLEVTGPGGSNTATKSGYIQVSSTSNNGLVAAYDFNEGSGTTVYDASGNGNHGSISGATWTSSGRFGKALLFDGVNDLVTVNDAASLDLTTRITLEAWVYPTANTGWRTVMLKERPGHLTYALYASSDTNQPLAQSVFTNGSNLKLRGPSQLPLNTWTHLAATYDGAAVRLYVNGTQVRSQAIASSMLTSGNPLRIGGNSVWGEFFKGRIDEVRIYNRALTASEIQVDLNKAVTPTTSGALTAQSTRVPLTLDKRLAALARSTPPANSARQAAANAPPTSYASMTPAMISEPFISDLLEVGEVHVDHRWTRVELRKPFVDPVVVAKALSYRQAEPVVVRIRHLDPTGFEMRIQPWDDVDGGRASETVGYLVLERGRYTLPDGTLLEGGTVETGWAQPDGSLAFSRPFRVVPVVVTSVADSHEANPITGQLTRISKDGFRFRIQGPELRESLDAAESISYIAWEPSVATVDGLTFEVNRTREVRRDQFHTILFRESFADPPVFLADIQMTRDGSPINLRWEHKDLDGIDVKIDAEPTLDGTATDATDVVGYISIR